MPQTDVDSGRIRDLPRLSVGVSAVAVLLVGVIAFPAPVPVGTAVLGGLLIIAGLYRRKKPWLALGASALFVAVVLAGPSTDAPGWYLAAALPVVLAWTSARYAVQLGRQVGRVGATLRVELVQVILTVTVLAAGGGAGYLISRSGVGSNSPLLLGVLLIAVVAFTIALR
jgi:hypothetical protein